MPWSRTTDGVIVIQFGKGDLIALTGYWDDRPGQVGVTIAEVPVPFAPGHPPRVRPGDAEGDLGERALVRFAFSDVAAVGSLIAPLEDVREALTEMRGGPESDCCS